MNDSRASVDRAIESVVAPGIWIGVTAASLMASLAMVQMRCKLPGNLPCGDWPADGYTWHFWPPFILLLVIWSVASRVWGRRHGRSIAESLRVHGEAVSPALGLLVSWGWYGLTGPQFHPPACATPILCHDAMPLSIVVWSAPWLAWSGWRIVRLWRI